MIQSANKAFPSGGWLIQYNNKDMNYLTGDDGSSGDNGVCSTWEKLENLWTDV